MKMITPPMAAVAGLGDHAGGVRIREVSVGAERDDLDQRARVDHLQAELSGKHIITMPHAKGVANIMRRCGRTWPRSGYGASRFSRMTLACERCVITSKTAATRTRRPAAGGADMRSVRSRASSELPAARSQLQLRYVKIYRDIPIAR